MKNKLQSKHYYLPLYFPDLWRICYLFYWPIAVPINVLIFLYHFIRSWFLPLPKIPAVFDTSSPESRSDDTSTVGTIDEPADGGKLPHSGA